MYTKTMEIKDIIDEIDPDKAICDHCGTYGLLVEMTTSLLNPEVSVCKDANKCERKLDDKIMSHSYIIGQAHPDYHKLSKV